LALSDERMIDLSDRLGVSVETVTELDVDLDDVLRQYSTAHPAFMGHIPFEMTIDLLGVLVSRDARIAFTSTPDWKYFDLHTKQEQLGWESASMSIEVFALPDRDAWALDKQLNVGRVSNAARWIRLELGERGVLTATLWEHIDAMIDQHCRGENARRLAARS